MKIDISKIDKNFTVQSKIEQDNIMWLDAAKEPISMYGCLKSALSSEDGEKFVRIPREIAAQTNEPVSRLYRYTSGIRAAFVTDSEYVAFNCKWDIAIKGHYQTVLSTCGFDMYVRTEGKLRYVASFPPPKDFENGYEAIYHFESRKKREILINFPLYNPVNEIYFGFEEGSEVKSFNPYKNENPVVFYGSSITQGGCSSRPGTCYPALLSRTLDIDFINLGFSDGARGEDVMAEYISGLDMCALIYDYDHNAPTEDIFEQTHYPFYKKIRDTHPDIPIICISRPCPVHSYGAPLGENWDFEKRKSIILNTYKKAKDAGDENIYFLDGGTFFEGEGADGCTVDGLHPNDLGFFRMAQVIAPVLAKSLGITNQSIY